MSGYIKKLLLNHQQKVSPRTPAFTIPGGSKKIRQSGTGPPPQRQTPAIPKEDVTRVQQIVGGILYYSRAVDLTMLAALSTIAAE